MLKLSRRQVDHEDVVAEGYAALRRAALYLTRGDEAEAGDLLHDTFVRFLLLRPRLEAIGNLDGYLYTMLRNVYLSRQRRHVRRRAVVTDTIEVDLLAVMVEVPEADERLRMRDDLMRLVDHARERTRVSRASSAWILRCVHGYYPAEIARLMKMPPRAIDRALHVARREALEELRKPAQRRRDGNDGDGRGIQRWRDRHVDPRDEAGGDAAEPLDSLQALRMRLFSSADGACLTDGAIAELYRPLPDSDSTASSAAHVDLDARTESGSILATEADFGTSRRADGSRVGKDADESDAPVGTLVMAHVVACAGCLDRINQHLDLPPLKGRDPVESIGTRQRRHGDSGRGPGAGGAAGSGQIEPHSEGRGGSANRGGAGLEPLMRRTRDTLASIVHHVPRELRIAANGLELGALPVAGVVTVQELAVRLAESLAFVEVFDERGELVCYWPARVPQDGLLDDDITIELPEGRSIELRVSLMDDCPRLRVRYTDTRISADAAARVHARNGVRDRVSVHDGRFNDGILARDESDADAGEAGRGAGLRDLAPSPLTALAAAAERLRWWQRLVPSPRFAIAGGVLVMLWMILIGPTTTWAAIGQLGRAAAAVIRTLLTSARPVTPTTNAPAAPSAPAASPSSAPIAAPRGGAAVRVFTPSELSDLEMAVRVALHDVRADLGEDITLRSTPAGVAVSGVIDTAARRDSITRALADLDGASVNVRTADEVSPLRRTSPASRVRRVPPAANAGVNAIANASANTAAAADATSAAAGPVAVTGESPTFANAIQEALAARMPAPADRAAYVNDTLARADEALARAWALRRLAERYQPRDATALSRRSSQSLATLVDDHTTALRTAVDGLITRVTPLVAATGDATPSGPSPDTRLSIMEMFTLVNAWHSDAHVLLAGAGAASHPDTREWLNRLHRIQDALNQPGFGQSTFTPR